MSYLAQLYKPSLSLLTDLYQLTMAYGYWKSGALETEAAFHLFFRTPPFNSGYSIACGLETVLEYIEAFGFTEEDTAFLATLQGNDGQPLFEAEFLAYLRGLKLSCDVDAMPEGTAVFPLEPLLRVQGPILECQLLETALLNIINFQTLIATKSARICLAAQGDPVLEFGLRRAQGPDGALAAARAAFVGGCAATSNVLAGQLFGIPVRGTHAHSWVMMFESEIEAFESYAAAMPNNCVFLVDTYDTLQGVRHAVAVGKKLRAQGHEMIGVRLDSGDLAYLSVEARKILDAGGFEGAKIFASNDLDEQTIDSLKDQGAQIGVWGVGTRLVTGHEQAALGGVYKLTAVRAPGGAWQPRIKLSEQAIKVTNPGLLQVRRYSGALNAGSAAGAGAEYSADVIYDCSEPLPDEVVMVHPLDATQRRRLSGSTPHRDLLQPAWRGGRRVAAAEILAQMQERTRRELAHFHGGVKRLLNPHLYPVGLEKGLYDRKTRLMLRARQENLKT
jgi:nicotinate phosphoribosyltransferase